MHATGRHDQVSVVERDDLAEALGDAAERKRGRRGWCVGQKPVGAGMNTQGMPNASDTRSAMARTPSVSVA